MGIGQTGKLTTEQLAELKKYDAEQAAKAKEQAKADSDKQIQSGLNNSKNWGASDGFAVAGGNPTDRAKENEPDETVKGNGEKAPETTYQTFGDKSDTSKPNNTDKDLSNAEAQNGLQKNTDKDLSGAETAGNATDRAKENEPDEAQTGNGTDKNIDNTTKPFNAQNTQAKINKNNDKIKQLNHQIALYGDDPVGMNKALKQKMQAEVIKLEGENQKLQEELDNN